MPVPFFIGVNMFEQLKQKFDEVQGVEIDSILEFMEEMKVAQTTAYYNAERQAKFRALNFEDVSDLLNVDRGNAIRLGLINNRLALAPRLTNFSSDVAYF